MNVPTEITNLILSFRERHYIRDVICCWYCKEEEYFNDSLYIYHRPRSRFRKYEIVCSDCNYEFSKDR